jgi:hypothetical protein
MTHRLVRIPSVPGAALGLVLAAAGCTRPRVPVPPPLDARLILPPYDTVAIKAQAVAHPCDRGAGVLLMGMDGGAGVLVWTQRQRVLASGDYPVVTRGDTTTPGAKVSVRFMSGQAGRGVTLDSGSVTLRVESDRVSAQVRGSGLDPGAGVRARLEADFRPLPLTRDTASCP